MRPFLPFVLLCATALPAPANSPIADVVCAPADQMRQRLTVEQGAELTGQGVRDPDSVLEVWSSDRGDWTLVIAYADGRRCIVGMGEMWETTRPTS